MSDLARLARELADLVARERQDPEAARERIAVTYAIEGDAHERPDIPEEGVWIQVTFTLTEQVKLDRMAARARV